MWEPLWSNSLSWKLFRPWDERRRRNSLSLEMFRSGPIVFILTFAGLLAHGQGKRLTTFGFKGGVNRSVINGREPNGSATGYIGVEMYASLFAEMELRNNWKFENELLYSFTDDYHFLEVPVHIEYKVIKNTLVFAGPKLDLVVSNDDAIYDFNNLGVSIDLGAKYEFTKRILAEFRYLKGLFPQVNDYALDIYDGRRDTLRLGLGFKF